MFPRLTFVVATFAFRAVHPFTAPFSNVARFAVRRLRRTYDSAAGVRSRIERCSSTCAWSVLSNTPVRVRSGIDPA